MPETWQWSVEIGTAHARLCCVWCDQNLQNFWCLEVEERNRGFMNNADFLAQCLLLGDALLGTIRGMIFLSEFRIWGALNLMRERASWRLGDIVWRYWSGCSLFLSSRESGIGFLSFAKWFFGLKWESLVHNLWLFFDAASTISLVNRLAYMISTIVSQTSIAGSSDVLFQSSVFWTNWTQIVQELNKKKQHPLYFLRQNHQKLK